MWLILFQPYPSKKSDSEGYLEENKSLLNPQPEMGLYATSESSEISITNSSPLFGGESSPKHNDSF